MARGSDEGGREGGDEGGAIKDGASEEMTRGTHLTAVYPALLTCAQQDALISKGPFNLCSAGCVDFKAVFNWCSTGNRGVKFDY